MEAPEAGDPDWQSEELDLIPGQHWWLWWNHLFVSFYKALWTVSSLPDKATVYKTSQRQTSQQICFFHEAIKSLLKLEITRKADPSVTCALSNARYRTVGKKNVTLLSFQNTRLDIAIAFIYGYTNLRIPFPSFYMGKDRAANMTRDISITISAIPLVPSAWPCSIQ